MEGRIAETRRYEEMDRAEFYENGTLKECICTSPVYFSTPCGSLIPKFDYSGIRDKYRNSITFYASGNIKSIYLQEQTPIETTLGTLKAELVTFYESGSIHRVFPRYGGINAYWTEEEELKLVPMVSKEINGILVNHKIMCYTFYETGQVKGLTFANNEVLLVDSTIGKWNVRIGITFYPNGSIETLEPSQMKLIHTSIGSYLAYNPYPVGIHGDDNSIRFDLDGNVIRFFTMLSGILIVNRMTQKIVERIKPKKKRSLLDYDLYEVVPIEIQIMEDYVVVIDSNQKLHRYSREENYFESSFLRENIGSSKSCSNCKQCANYSQCSCIN